MTSTALVPASAAAALALLEWQIAMGADEAIDAVAPDRFALLPAPTATPVSPAERSEAQAPLPARPPVAVAPPSGLAESLAEAAVSARRQAAEVQSIAELGAAVAA